MGVNELIAWRCKRQLIFFGYSETEINRLGDLTEITKEQMNELIRSKNLQPAEDTGEETNKTARNVPVIGPSRITTRVEPGT